MPNQFLVTDQGNPDALSIAQVVENIVTQRQQKRLPVIQENKELFEKIRKAINDLAGVNLLKVKEVAPMLHKILMETDFNKLDDKLKNSLNGQRCWREGSAGIMLALLLLVMHVWARVPFCNQLPNWVMMLFPLLAIPIVQELYPLFKIAANLL